MEFLDNLTNKIKNVYYSCEDKWYTVLDKIDKKVPVYKVIDPIDEIIPSFILFLITILFVIILLGYLIQFSSPYEVKFLTFDSESKDVLSQVNLEGYLNNFDFETKTNSNGIAIVTVNGISENIYSIILKMLFGDNSTLEGTVNAQKNGYNSLNNVELETGKEFELFLEKESEELNFLGLVKIALYDNETKEKIIDSSNKSYVKFNCSNKTINNKIVKDDSDGVEDGVFILNEPSCDFVITYAYSPGFESKESFQKIGNATEIVKVYLDKLDEEINGTAKVWVYEKGTNKTKPLNQIPVQFVGVTGLAYTNPSGVAVKPLPEGEYLITITDENYYSITPTDAKKIIIETGKISEITIELEKKNITDARKVFFKVIDSNNDPINNAKIKLTWITTTQNKKSNFSSGDMLVQVQGTTDANGLFESRVFSKRDEGKILAIIDKSSFVITPFVPTLKNYSDSYETIEIDNATATNSASVLIQTNAGDYNKPLMNAKAMPIYSFKVDGNIIYTAFNIKDTNADGYALFERMPTEEDYYGLAKYKNTVANSNTNDLNAGEINLFNIHFDLGLAEIKINLKDMQTRQTITSGEVKSYILNDDQLDLFEVLTKSSNKFVSTLTYDIEEQYIFTAKAEGYIENSLYISNDNYLKQGVNEFNLFLAKDITIDKNDLACDGNFLYTNEEQWACITTLPSCADKKYVWDENNLVCSNNCEGQFIAVDNYFVCYPNNFNYSPDGKIGIFYDNLYSNKTSANNENPNVNMIEKDKSYYIKFRTVVYDEDVSGGNLFSMTRTDGANLTNINSNPQTNTKGLFSCTSIANDGVIFRDQNYYLLNNCTSEIKISSGLKWTNIIKKTYNFLNQFKVTNDTNEFVTFNYRGGVNKTSYSETPLLENSFEIGKPLNEGLFAKINIGGQEKTSLFNTNNRLDFKIDYDLEKNFDLTIVNNTNEIIDDVGVSVYSHTGPLIDFNKDANGKGNIVFEGDVQKIVLGISALIEKYSEKKYNTTVKSNQISSNDTIIILVTINGEENFIYLDTTTAGNELNLDAEFLSGVVNPNINGTVQPKLTSLNSVTLKEVIIKVDEGCNGNLDNDYLVYNLNNTTSENGIITNNTFSQKVDGLYKQYIDCAYITIIPTPTDDYFSPIIDKKIYAKPNNTTDASIACVQITDNSANTDISLNFGEEKEIIVTNQCNKDIKFYIDTLLVCKTKDGATCNPVNGISLASDEEKKLVIKGENVSYDSSKPFSDVLGFFPVYVKARFADTRKKFTLADMLFVHLSNNKQCFSISSDNFDLIDTDSEQFVITNHCQDTTIDDYFIPSAYVNSMEYTLDSTKPDYTTTITFNPKLIVTGGTFEYIPQIVTVESVTGGLFPKEMDSIPSEQITVGPNFNTYSNIRIDFDLDSFTDANYDWKVKKIQMHIYDLNNSDNNLIGLEIIGNVNLIYENASTKQYNPTTKTIISPRFSCTGTAECIVDTFEEDILNSEGMIYGMFYLELSESQKGKIVAIDMNLKGDKNTDNLRLTATPLLTYNYTDYVIDLGSESETTSEISLGTYEIPPLENIDFVLTDFSTLEEVNYAEWTDKTNSRVYVESGNSMVRTWVNGDKIQARFIGSDFASYNDKTIEYNLVKVAGRGTSHILINIKDYVSDIIATSEGRTITGSE